MNRKIPIIFCMLMCAVSFLKAQTLIQMRCYFDGNEAQSQYIPIENLASVDAPFTVDVSALSKGVHKMYIEVMNDAGKWSQYDVSNIQVIGGVDMALLNAVEYYYDEDPGFGQGMQIAVSGTEINNDFDLSLEGLSNGVHRLYVRVRDAAGQWSQYDAQLIQVNGAEYASIVAGEYFLDVDPGLGLGNPIDIAGLIVDEDLDLSLEGVPNGVHKLYVRVQDDRGQWSLTDEANIQVGNPNGSGNANILLIAAEYYFDVDPGEGNGIPLAIPNEVQVNSDFDITLPALADGMHIMYMRVQNDQEVWSTVAQDTIYICDIEVPDVVSSGNNCSGGMVTLNAGSGYDAYLWSTGSQSQSINVTQGGTYSVTVYSGACSAQDSETISFVDIQSPEIEITGTLCEGTTATLDAGAGYDSYSWSNSGTDQTTTVDEGGNYSVIVTLDGCSSFASAEVDYIPTPQPDIEIVGELCAGNIVMLDAGPGFTSYSWTGGALTQSIPVNQNGTYSVIVYEGDCFGSDSQVVTFIALPVPGINQNGNVLICDATGVNYQWFFNGQPISGATSQTYNATQSGNYSVMILDGSCSEESDDFAFVYDNVWELDPTFALYPNPANEGIRIVTNGAFDYYLTDATGRLLAAGRIQSSEWIPTSSLANGVYFLAVDGIKKRFVVQH